MSDDHSSAPDGQGRSLTRASLVSPGSEAWAPVFVDGSLVQFHLYVVEPGDFSNEGTSMGGDNSGDGGAGSEGTTGERGTRTGFVLNSRGVDWGIGDWNGYTGHMRTLDNGTRNEGGETEGGETEGGETGVPDIFFQVVMGVDQTATVDIIIGRGPQPITGTISYRGCHGRWTPSTFT